MVEMIEFKLQEIMNRGRSPSFSLELFEWGNQTRVAIHYMIKTTFRKDIPF